MLNALHMRTSKIGRPAATCMRTAHARWRQPNDNQLHLVLLGGCVTGTRTLYSQTSVHRKLRVVLDHELPIGISKREVGSVTRFASARVQTGATRPATVHLLVQGLDSGLSRIKVVSLQWAIPVICSVEHMAHHRSERLTNFANFMLDDCSGFLRRSAVIC